jgi:hypothetical protein
VKTVVEAEVFHVPLRAPTALRSAWNLFCTFLVLQDQEAAMRVFTVHLLSLVMRDPETLPPVLRKTQADLVDWWSGRH